MSHKEKQINKRYVILTIGTHFQGTFSGRIFLIMLWGMQINKKQVQMKKIHHLKFNYIRWAIYKMLSQSICFNYGRLVSEYLLSFINRDTGCLLSALC